MKNLLWIILFVTTLNFSQSENKKMNVAIFIYDNVEILDFAGPGEVFAATRVDDDHPFNVYTVAVDDKPILSQGFVTITPQYTIKNCPKPDIIVLPGGSVLKSVENEEVIR